MVQYFCIWESRSLAHTVSTWSKFYNSKNIQHKWKFKIGSNDSHIVTTVANKQKTYTYGYQWTSTIKQVAIYTVSNSWVPI